MLLLVFLIQTKNLPWSFVAISFGPLGFCWSYYFHNFFSLFLLYFSPPSLSLAAICGILVTQPGIEPVSPPVETWNPNYCTATEVPSFLNELPFQLCFMLLSCIFHFLLNREEEARKELWGQSFFLARSVVFLPILTPTHIYVRPSKT